MILLASTEDPRLSGQALSPQGHPSNYCRALSEAGGLLAFLICHPVRPSQLLRLSASLVMPFCTGESRCTDMVSPLSKVTQLDGGVGIHNSLAFCAFKG